MSATLRRGLSWQIENYVDLIPPVDQKQWTHISICQLDPLCGLAADIIFNLPTQSSLWIRAADIRAADTIFMSGDLILSADLSGGHNFRLIPLCRLVQQTQFSLCGRNPPYAILSTNFEWQTQFSICGEVILRKPSLWDSRNLIIYEISFKDTKIRNTAKFELGIHL
ncbi:hypothetical protein B0H13DRAFT_1880332 [Mycena leptocephala]|nr:hypothetical protein B0H13DRAFT_1880332 [Mycena leptocephala]